MADANSSSEEKNYNYMAPVKPQYLIETKPVNDISPVPPEAAAAETNSNETKTRFLKRPRDEVPLSDKLCQSYVSGNGCAFSAENCRYSHDLASFMKERPVDLPGTCPSFALYNFCKMGALCRYGSVHINPETGENIIKEGTEIVEEPDPINVLDKDIQVQLRKNKYPFITARRGDNKHGQKKGQRAEEPKEGQSNSAEDSAPTNETTPAMSLAPFPSKTVKLIDFSNKIYVAPLTTVGNLPFRRIMKKFGVDITCGEMAMCTNLLSGQSSEWALLRRHPSEDVFGVQIAAAHADQFARTAELISSHMQVDFVDVNMGCPIDLVVNRGAGSSLMTRPNKIQQLVTALSTHLTCPMTLKMRVGWNDNKPVAHQIIHSVEKMNTGNISAFMIHGRSRLQRYSRCADWDYIHKVASGTAAADIPAPTIPIIGNGDIMSFVEWEEHKAMGAISPTCMLARGALIKPWLATEIKESRHWDISSSERFDIIKDFVRFGLEHWGSDQKGVNNVRRFLLEWLSFLHRYIPIGLLERLPQHINLKPPNYCGRDDLETLMASKDSNDWVKITEMLLGPVPEGFKFLPKHKANSVPSSSAPEAEG